MPIIEARKVAKTYTRGGFFSRAESVPVLHEVNMTISPGQCVGLVGRSGSGKSTLGRLLLGLELPNEGEVKILGKSTRGRKGRPHLNGEQRRAVQVVFQDAIGSVNPRLTAEAVISEPLRNFEKLSKRELKERVVELLVTVGLEASDADKRPSCFSGGQLQRISIARALAANPRCIVLDEALSSLDMIVQARILDLLDTLRREKDMAYLFVTHDLRLIKRFCDKAMIMEEGRLHEFDHTNPGAPAEQKTLQKLSAALLPACPLPGKTTDNDQDSEARAV